jgi:hypothetical protein
MRELLCLAALAACVRAFVLLMRDSGMRIGDTASCARDRITGRKVFLQTEKVKVPSIKTPVKSVLKLHQPNTGNRERKPSWLPEKFS